MSSLVSNAQTFSLTGAQMNLFDTLKRPIIVYKEPLQNVVNNTNVFAGYGPTSEDTQITYTTVSGVFYAMKCNPLSKVDSVIVPLTENAIYSNQIRIKVLPEAMNYITQGKTEAILYDGILYRQVSKALPQNFLGLQFYHFDLKQTD